MAYYAVTVSAPGASTGTTSYYTQTASGGLGRRVGGRHRSYRGGGGGWKRKAPTTYKGPTGAESWSKVMEHFSGPELDKALKEHPTLFDKSLTFINGKQFDPGARVGSLGKGWGGGLFGVTTVPRGKGVSGPDPTRYVKFQTTSQKAQFQAEQTALADAKAQARQAFSPTKPTAFGRWPSKQAYLDWRAAELTSYRQSTAAMRKAAESLTLQPRFTRRSLGRGRGAMPARLRLPRARQARAAMKRHRQRELGKVRQAESAVNLWETQTQV